MIDFIAWFWFVSAVGVGTTIGLVAAFFIFLALDGR